MNVANAPLIAILNHTYIVNACQISRSGRWTKCRRYMQFVYATDDMSIIDFLTVYSVPLYIGTRTVNVFNLEYDFMLAVPALY